MPQKMETMPVQADDRNIAPLNASNEMLVVLAIRIVCIALLAYWSVILVQPFLAIILWAIIIAVAIYPIFNWLAATLRGRRVLAAIVVSVLGLLVLLGPVTWLGVSLADSVRKIVAGFKFIVAAAISGFLLVPGPSLVQSMKNVSRHLTAARGVEFVDLAGATIRNVSRGIIGVAALQTLLAGLGMLFVGIPAAGLFSFMILLLGIIQIGPTIVIVPLIVWSWFTMSTAMALAFTLYMLPVMLVDNVLRPLVMAKGLKTPIPVILCGVIGGTLAHGMIGLFIGPIVFSIAWQLLTSWMGDDTEEMSAAS
jgi:predicted PurR-regulated permease PerM